jgi:hypothetical protein
MRAGAGSAQQAHRTTDYRLQDQGRGQRKAEKLRGAEEGEVSRSLCLDGLAAGRHAAGIDTRVEAR